MEINIISHQFKQSFSEIPEDDSRAKIGPQLFVMALIFSLIEANAHWQVFVGVS